MVQINHYEQQFLDALKDIFIGAKVEGDSGYINLMKIKSRYFTEGVFPQLMKDIDSACKPFEKSFREELFDKLYDFFKRYFSESGSIYFRHTALHNNIYEKVYTENRDVMLFWKTHMLYYVKTDRIFNSMETEVDNTLFLFDVSELEHKRANEKRELVYSFKRYQESKLILNVSYSEKGRKTKGKDILGTLKEKGIRLEEETLQRAIHIFEKQSEVDYFINKNAKAFLKEQFDLWLFEYVFKGESDFNETRLKQLQTIKNLAYKIIDFIAQFEDELVKVWNKPKFVLNSHYIITLDKITNPKLLKKIMAHKGMKTQLQEWQDLGMVEKGFEPGKLFQKNALQEPENAPYQFLPLDTRYFPDLELEILALFEDLDAALDGLLVHSENYQALITLLPKFQERIKAIYIDPPYNTDASEIDYVNNYKHSSWMTLIENRLNIAKNLLNKEGILCVTIDHVELAQLKAIITQLFGEDTHLGLVTIKNNPSGRSTVKGFSIANEFAIFVGATNKVRIGSVPRNDEQNAQYPEEDKDGFFQWRGFMRSGGQNDFREERTRLHYPLFTTKDSVRIPEMNWDQETETWILAEKPQKNETVVYPISKKGIEYTWRLGVETLKERIKDLRIRPNKDDKLALEVKFRPGDVGILPKTIWDNKLFNATAYGRSLRRSLFGIGQLFSFPKSVYAVEEAIKVSGTKTNDYVLDFFAGSGTTAHAIINLNRNDGGKRKYILAEMDGHFDSVILPRIKKVVFSDQWKDGVSQPGKGISHFCKYYDLEQYEDTLRRASYQESDMFATTDTYNNYVFLRDLKMLDAISLNKKENKVNVHLEKLYPGIDLAETLSCITGKGIKRVTAETVEFQDGTFASLTNPDWALIKPLVWW